MKMNQFILRISFGLMLVLLVGVSAWPMIAPKAVGTDAPARRFSAGRAMNDLAVVSKKPHSAGSPEQATVRDYIIAEIKKLELSAELQASGGIKNIIVRLPGTDPTLAVLITGHYDSRQSTPGAGDDGISTVAMLESIRVLKASPPMRNDVFFLFTDGEEAGWLGAKAFIKNNPNGKQSTGVVLVFDARPGNAPLVMSETTPGDGWLIRQMTGIPLRVWAGSWNNREERMEFNTDFDVFQPAGYTGVVFENEINGTKYHTERDTVEAISADLVQAYGQTILALTNRFGGIDLNTKTTTRDLVYFNTPLVGLIAYPSWVMLVLSILAILAIPACILFAWRKKRYSLKNFLLGAGGLLAGIVISVAIAQLIWSIVQKSHAHEIAAYGRFEGSAGWHLGLMIAAAVLMIVIQFILARKLGEVNTAAAGMVLYIVIWTVVYFIMETDNPLTTPNIALPLLGSTMGTAVLLLFKNPILKFILLALSALIMLVLIVPSLWLGSYTGEGAWLTVLVTSLVLCLFVPFVEAVFGKEFSSSKGSLVPGETSPRG